MSSLLKMNHKFLSKSSWSIRGGGGGGSGSNNQSNGPAPKFIPNGGKNMPHAPHDQLISPLLKQQTLTVNGTDKQHHRSIPSNSNWTNNNRTTTTVNNNNQQLHSLNDNCNKHDKHLPSDTAQLHINSSYNNEKLVRTPKRSNCPASMLKRAKGLSVSITDLRELKKKPPSKMMAETNDGENELEREIKERRIDMYIAEIELDPVCNLGPTIRWKPKMADAENSIFNNSMLPSDKKFDHLLLELESSDASTIALVLRAIYDGDEQDRFMEKLDLRIKNHDKDIERMCNCHYQGFVDAIHELLKIRPQALDMKNEILQINQEVVKSTENIHRKTEELIKYCRVQCNTQTAIEKLQECLPILETFSKLNQQMNEKKYYSALKTLEQFERSYMHKLKKYRFAQTMCQRIPKIRETIKIESMKELKDFLENIRQLTFKIGEIAMKNTAFRFKSKEFASVLLNDDGQFKIESKSNTLKKKKNGLDYDNDGIVDMALDTPEDDDYLMLREDLSATDLVDFSPVYRCLHIFGCLGVRVQFALYYRQQRKQQARLILQSFTLPLASGLTHGFNRESFRNYLFGVVGFFVIEDHLLNTSNGLVTKNYLEENWNDVIQSLTESVHQQASLCQDSEQMLYMKNLLMLFCETTHNYGYAVEAIMKLLVDLRQLNTDILLKQWSLVFKKIFDTDNYHPLVVSTPEEFESYFGGFNADEMEMFKDKDGTVHRMDVFPKTFPFSSFVPKVYKEVKKFIMVCLKFIEDLNINDIDKEDTVRKSTNLLLTRTLSDSLSSLIKKPYYSLLQLIQISINSNYLEECSAFLESYISELIHNKSSKEVTSDNFASSNRLKYALSIEPASQSHLARLQGRNMFKDIRAEAESQIYLQLNNKIEEIFSLASYDYMLLDSPGKASQYMLDLMAFLKSTFEAFTNLPPKVAQAACLSACKFISSRLLNILLDDDVKAISHGFLQQFNLDLMQCEMFAGSEPVKDFEEALQSCFGQLRQTMDLFMEFDSWSTYFAEYGKNESRYLRVNPHIALTLLEKLVRGDSKKTIFSALSKNERDKKQKIDTILKKLKQLVANTTSANH